MHAKSLLETRQKVRVCVPTAIGNDATRDGARIDLNQTSLRPGSYRVGGGRQRLPLRCVQRKPLCGKRSKPPASSSSTRTVVAPACAFVNPQKKRVGN